MLPGAARTVPITLRRQRSRRWSAGQRSGTGTAGNGSEGPLRGASRQGLCGTASGDSQGLCEAAWIFAQSVGASVLTGEKIRRGERYLASKSEPQLAILFFNSWRGVCNSVDHPASEVIIQASDEITARHSCRRSRRSSTWRNPTWLCAHGWGQNPWRQFQDPDS